MPVITSPADISTTWLSAALGETVVSFSLQNEQDANWSRHWPITATLASGARRALRLKLCLGDTFGPSELHYYTRDYLGLADAPLPRCHQGCFEPGVGYHLLLQDISATHTDARDLAPGLAYGVAVATLLGRMHAHHWQTQAAPGRTVMDRYLAEAQAGLPVLQGLVGVDLADDFARLAQQMHQRWSQPEGMSLLHGDLNPTNILCPRTGPGPMYFIDRQPFDWSLTYGLAVSDLAYLVAIWWPIETRRALQWLVLRAWHTALNQPAYTWAMAQADWRLSVLQCLCVPLEWCAKPDTALPMRWLWEAQLTRILSACAEAGQSTPPEA
ncbi:MAG: phosphotransferase [Vitreoscilla sp.]|nr:phosphotransferase [Vitreoscilla sp.]